ncbi:MAG: hypothetical protein PVI92_07435 [Chromatiales bacterium]|jgi:hypothetical protein
MTNKHIEKKTASMAFAALSGKGGCAEGEHVINATLARRLGLIGLFELLCGREKGGRSHA